MLRAAAAFSGGAVSPARALGPAIVFHCHWNKVWIYVLGEVFGCIVAGILACPLYGGHAKYLDPLIRAQLSTCSTACSASPPMRLSQTCSSVTFRRRLNPTRHCSRDKGGC